MGKPHDKQDKDKRDKDKQDKKETNKIRKSYEKPAVTKLTPEQAKLKLLGHASMGDQGAKDLLEMMFPETAQKDSKSKKKSA
jgi:hypothetical protein